MTKFFNMQVSKNKNVNLVNLKYCWGKTIDYLNFFFTYLNIFAVVLLFDRLTFFCDFIKAFSLNVLSKVPFNKTYKYSTGSFCFAMTTLPPPSILTRSELTDSRSRKTLFHFLKKVESNKLECNIFLT